MWKFTQNPEENFTQGRRVSSPKGVKNAQKFPPLAGVDPNGLICLKGGDLTKEIAESHCRPRMMEITEIFDEAVFEEKYILYVPLNK